MNMNQSSQPARTAEGPLILIVDDSPTDLHIMKKALEGHGFRTLLAKDGAEGIRLARQVHPSLILMDIVMPGVNGYQATRALRADPETSGIPIVMVTYKGQQTDRIWGLRQGAVDYVVKPLSGPELVQKAQAALAA
jgi:twitching motility two-component system response regulator PilH